MYFCENVATDISCFILKGGHCGDVKGEDQLLMRTIDVTLKTVV